MHTINSGAGPKARSKILDRDHKRSTTPVQAYLIAHPLCASGSATGSKACRDPRTV
jgi:hypothetical protein